jgi:magnesium chelatase subunit D
MSLLTVPLEDDADLGPWADADLAAALLAIDPQGLGGAIVRAGAGPVRDHWLQLLQGRLSASCPVVRIPVNVGEDRLLGGLDLSATLSAGALVVQSGLLAQADGGVALLPMAERTDPGVTAQICAALDRGEIAAQREGLSLSAQARFGLIALDEGREDEDRVSSGLADRLAFHVFLESVSWRQVRDTVAMSDVIAAARVRRQGLPRPDDALVEAACDAAQRLGVMSVRAVLLSLQAAAAHAALEGRSAIILDDLVVAARLVLVPRCVGGVVDAPPPPADTTGETDPPPSDTDDPPTDPPETPDTPKPEEDSASDAAPPTPEALAEMVVQAMRALLPEAVNTSFEDGARAARQSTRGRGGGALARSATRGRPLGSRPGMLKAGVRLDLIETLRAAAPWQGLRGGAAGDRLRLRKEDLRIRRFVQRTELTTVFVVDASGSTAFQRLAEAKGAVEQMLARAYVSRARVALIAFHHGVADLLLPPTRSLTRAKRLLADLPGGGGTPLASAIDAASAVALSERGKARTPMVVFLTDGRANIDRAGQPGRAAADKDALAAGRRLAATGTRTLYIDTALRPQPEADRFSRAMGGVYATLPFCASGAVVDLVRRELAAAAS